MAGDGGVSGLEDCLFQEAPWSKYVCTRVHREQAHGALADASYTGARWGEEASCSAAVHPPETPLGFGGKSAFEPLNANPFSFDMLLCHSWTGLFMK